MYKIAAGLETDGILTGAGKTEWQTSTINKILRNEKYIGDVLLQKIYLHNRLSDKEAHQEHWHRPTILCGVRSQSNYSERNLSTGSGRTGPQRCGSHHRKRQTVMLLWKHCFAQIVFYGEFRGFYQRVHWNNEAASLLSGNAAACWKTPATPVVVEQ